MKFKAEDTDKSVLPFNTQEEAIAFAQTTLKRKLNKRSEPFLAPKELRKDDRNPTMEEIEHRMWGLNKTTPVRMAPTHDSKWCVWWRPSLVAGLRA